MNHIFYIVLLFFINVSCMEREQYQEIPDINLNNQTNINQVTHDITLVQPPSTRVPGEIDKSQINKAKKLAFQIVIETLKT